MYVIFGATGKIGRATIHELRDRGAPVRAVVRDRSTANELAMLGCDVAIADLLDTAAISRAIDGATAVQVICPTDPTDADPSSTMDRLIDSISRALTTALPPAVLAISDYGAHLDAGTGITLAFHRLERRLRQLPTALTLVRSAAHMQNFARVLGAVADTGVFPSFHLPLTQPFITVSAPDVGIATSELLLAPAPSASPRVVHVEGPRRYTAEDVASTLSVVLGRDVVARGVPRVDWIPALGRGGMSPAYAQLIAETLDAENAGRIDVDPTDGFICRGTTELGDVFESLVPAR
jgi:NAD(P)H dehydrogenase (quinone)